MEKKMYETPEMEAVKFACNKMLMASGDGEQAPGTGDSEEL